MTDCSRLAKIPEPTLSPVDVGACVRRVAELEKRLPIRVVGGPDVTVPADQDQLEQVLINLLRNAVEASVETRGAVEVGWAESGRWIEITIRDEGSGLVDTESLFIPFYTTKATGSGIGLFLCRHVAEAHGGSVTVRNRNDHPGCEAVLRLPSQPG
jgi:signal transduction histidine kinase